MQIGDVSLRVEPLEPAHADGAALLRRAADGAGQGDGLAGDHADVGQGRREQLKLCNRKSNSNIWLGTSSKWTFPTIYLKSCELRL